MIIWIYNNLDAAPCFKMKAGGINLQNRRNYLILCLTIADYCDNKVCVID